jgi:hypothetical protein
VPEQKFDLLQIPAILPAKFGASAAQVWAPKCSMPICLDDCSTTDQIAQSLSVSRLIFPLFDTDRSSRPSSTADRDHPGVDTLLDPDRDGDGADAPAFALEIGQDHRPLPLLDGLDIELGQFVAPEGAADQKRQDHVVAFPLSVK